MCSNEYMKKFAEIHCLARLNSNKSQEYMAEALNVSKRTIQNWESGETCPSFFQSIEWFKVLNINPFPYYFKIIYPQKMDVNPNDNDEKIEEAFYTLMQNISIEDKRALLYLYYGKHGSSPHSIIQLLLAHLHLPMSFRINDACNINTNYKLAKELNILVCPENIQPDLTDFRKSIYKAVDACKNNMDRYGVFDVEIPEDYKDF